MSILGVLIKVGPELVVAEGFVPAFGKGIVHAKSRKSADKANRFDVDDDASGIVGVIVGMLQNKGIGSRALDPHIRDRGPTSYVTGFTARVVLGHDVIV